MRRLILIALLAAATCVPAAAQERVVLGGPMRFSADSGPAFMGWFVGGSGDVWRIEPFGYLSEDADVWAVVTGVAVPVRRGCWWRFSVRFGTEIVLHGTAVEPGAHPLIGAGVRLGSRYGFTASVDRAPDFTLIRAGVFIRW